MQHEAAGAKVLDQQLFNLRSFLKSMHHHQQQEKIDEIAMIQEGATLSVLSGKRK